MKELKKIVNEISDFLYKWFGKFFKLLSSDKNSQLVKFGIKVIVLIIIYLLIGFFANSITVLGKIIIYDYGTNARAILYGLWRGIVNFSYSLFVIVSLYRLITENMNNNFIVLSNDKVKNKELKKKVHISVEVIARIVCIIFLLPLFAITICLLYVLGLMAGYALKGIYLISLFAGVIGSIIFATTLIFMIKKMFSKSPFKSKNYLYIFIFSTFLICTSTVGINIETTKFERINSLTNDFTTMRIKNEYKINNKIYYITNNGKDQNINMVIDDDLGSYLEVIIDHADTSLVSSHIEVHDNKVFIKYEQDLDLNLRDLNRIYNMGITMIKDKKLYNYTYLKYATIEVRVSSDYAKNIRFINAQGREYCPDEK